MRNMIFLKGYFAALVNPTMMPTALKVSATVGSLLLAINHGSALINSTMTRGRWISVGLTYLVPYAVNIHGQYSATSRQMK